MKSPRMYSAAAIKNWDVDKEIVSGAWGPARPYHSPCLKCRFVLAWKVFTGKCDALYWMDD